MRGGAGTRMGGSKKSKPILALPRSVRLKSCSIPASPPLWGGENLHGAKQEGAKLPSLFLCSTFDFWRGVCDTISEIFAVIWAGIF